jgi:hypothetical protein
MLIAHQVFLPGLWLSRFLAELVLCFPQSLIGSERGYALNEPEHRHAADGVGRHQTKKG